MNRESDEEQHRGRVEGARLARRRCQPPAATSTIGPDFGTNYRLGGLQDYGEEDLADDDEALDEGIEADDDEDEDDSPPS